MSTLRIVRTLVWKDLRSMAVFLAVLIVSNCAYLVLIPFRNTFFSGNPSLRVLSFFLVEPVQFILLPALLFGMVFNMEWNSGARYQLLALPVHRWRLLSGKPFLLLSTVFLTISITVYLSRILNPPGISHTPLLLLVLWQFSFIFFGVCAGIFAQGFSMVFRRYRFTAWFLAFLWATYIPYNIVFSHGIVNVGALWMLSAAAFAAGLSLFTRFVEA